MIEADLQLKLEMRSIKEQFLLLLENFAQFEQCHMDPGADIVVNRGAYVLSEPAGTEVLRFRLRRTTSLHV